MNDIAEMVAFVLGFLGWVMAGVAVPNRYWKESTLEGSVITTTTIYENLWISCASDASGIHNCREFPSLLALSGYLQVSRALMVTSIVLGFCAILVSMLGLQCTKVGGDNYTLKGRLAGLGGLLFLLQGLCTMISVSWYAFNITQEFFDPFYLGTKYELGQGLYIGWGSAVLAIGGGVCLLCACRQESEGKVGYAYQPSKGSQRNPHNQYDHNSYV
ncbi:claudin-15 isoform X2 [Lepisosteus oculatus]|uniref:claudin-15 isoform X2 n=1 Tax=Lepisosteus oculatus TaxID=7918 RepID=UPI003715BCE1